MADIRPVSIVCGTSVVTLYIIGHESVLEPEYDLTEIYESEELVLKRADSLITAINIYNLSAGEEHNCLSFIKNKFRVDFNNVNSACKDLYVRFLREFVLDDHFLMETLRNAYNSTVTVSLKYSTGTYLSGSLESMANYSKGFKDDDWLFILVVYFGKLLKALPNNAYLHSIRKVIRLLTDCDPCIVRDAPQDLQELYELMIYSETDDHNVLDPCNSNSDDDSDDSWSYDPTKIRGNAVYNNYSKSDYYNSPSSIYRNYENSYYENSYYDTYNKYSPYGSYSSHNSYKETDKEKAARAIDEYYSSDTVLHQYNWHTKWAELHKKICPDAKEATAEDFLFDFTTYAFNENDETMGINNVTNTEEVFPEFSDIANIADEKQDKVITENYGDLYDDISVNSYSVPTEDPLDEFTDFMYGFDHDSNANQDKSTKLMLYEPEDNLSPEHEQYLSNYGQATLREIDRLIASVPDDDLNILEQDYSPRSSSWIWELD